MRATRTEADLVRDVALGRIGAELFGWLILVAAFAMAIDWMLANRFYAPLDDQTAIPPPLPVEETVLEGVPT